MLGFPDSLKCPVDIERFGEGSGSEDAFGAFPGGMLRITFNRNDDVEEILSGNVRGYVFDHALTPDEVKREYETKRITVNKTTHRIRFENETESSVDVVIEPKE